MEGAPERERDRLTDRQSVSQLASQLASQSDSQSDIHSACVLIGLPLSLRKEFIIGNARGQECVYSKELGFGSAYSLIISGNLTFNADVSHPTTRIHLIPPRP